MSDVDVRDILLDVNVIVSSITTGLQIDFPCEQFWIIEKLLSRANDL